MTVVVPGKKCAMDDERSRELTERAHAATARSRELAERVADLADRGAATEDSIVAVHENLAGDEQQDARRQRTIDEAREFAAHERRESARWRAVADGDDGTTAEGPDEAPPEPAASR